MGNPPELESLNSMLRIAKIISLIFMVLSLIAGIGAFVALAAFGLGFFGAFALIWFIVDLIIYLQIGQIQDLVRQNQFARAKEKTFLWMILGLIFGGVLIGIFLILAYIKFDPVLNWQRSLGGGAAPGWGAPAAAQSQGWGQPAQPQAQSWGQPSQPQGGWSSAPAQPAPASGGWSSPPAASAPQAAPAAQAAPTPAMAPAAPQAMTCPRCGKPATWIAQYSRWYCYTDSQYV